MSRADSVPLDRCIESIRAGVSLSGEARRPTSDEIGILTLGAVSGGELQPDACKALPRERAVALGGHVRAGTLLMSRSNTAALVGAVVLVEQDHTDRFLPDLLWEIRLRPDSPVTPAFLADFLQSDEGRRLLQSAAMGTSGSMKKLSMGRVRAIEVPVVSRAVQEAWGAVRSRFRHGLSTMEHLLAEKRAFKRALLHELLTGRRRLPAFAKAAPWRSVPLGELVDSVTRRNANGSAERVLTCSGEHGLIDQRQFFSKLVAGDSREGYFLLKRGEFAYNRSAMSGYPYGATKRLDRYDSGVVSTLNICFALRNDACTSDFLLHLFESGLLNQQLGRIARVGSRAHGLLNVTKTEFFRLEVRLPSVAEQERITSALNAADREIALLEQLRDAHEAQKRALMQRLLSGDLPLPAPARTAHLAHA